MNKSKILAAIDVGSSKVVTVLAQVRDEESKLHIVGAASVPSRGVRKGQVVNIEETVDSIVESVESAERMAGFNVAKAWVSIDGAHVASQNSKGVVAVADTNGEINADDVSRVLEAARAISLPASSEILHVVPRSFTVNGQTGIKDPVGMTGVRLEVDTHIITGSTTVIKNLTKCISEVGCDVAGLAFAGFASSEAVLSETEKELGVILIDIGGGTTDVAIYTDGALNYSAVIPVGAKNVTSDLAIGLRISLESAEKIKIYLSSLKSKEREDEIDLSGLSLPEEIKSVSYKTVVEGIIRPRLNELFRDMVGAEVKKSNLAGLTPSGLVICGGGALTVGLVDSAKRMLSMPVRVGIPGGIAGLIDEIESPAYATVVGLLRHAWRSSETESSGNKFTLPVKGAMGKINEFIKSLLP